MKITADQVVALESADAAPRGPNGRLAALASESRGQVATLATLQQYHGNQEETDDDVNDCDQNCHDNKTPYRAMARFQLAVLHEVRDSAGRCGRELDILRNTPPQTVQSRRAFS